VDEGVARRSARAILLDGDELLLIKRTRPGSSTYWVTIGGGCEAQDASLEHTLAREAAEEAGAVINLVQQVLALTDRLPDGAIAVQHIFLATLVEIDPRRRSGAEFTQPERGTYELVRVAFTGENLAAIDLRPAALAAYLQENWTCLAATAKAALAGPN
jgi:8-oxo-dGTP pyrophosphatase MutT (NUDIX family)